MNKKHRNIVTSTAQYTRSFEKIRGFCAERTPSEDAARFGISENMYVDYGGGGEAVESFPGYRRLASFGKRINGLFTQHLDGIEDCMIIHAGDSVYRVNKSELDGFTPHGAIATVRDVKSSSFTFGDALYLIDGESILQIDKKGGAIKIGDDGLMPYVPTVYRNSEPYEKRNLLTFKGKESYTLDHPSELIHGTPGLRYVIIDWTKRHCIVTGGVDVYGELHIPSHAVIEGLKYTVTAISAFAFSGNEHITSVTTNAGLKEIGEDAFANCKGITKVIASHTVARVGERAFSGCSALTDVHFGLFPLELGAQSFAETAVQQVRCAGATINYQEVTAGSGLEGKEYTYEPPYAGLTLGFTVHEPANRVDGVSFRGKSVEYRYDEGSRTVTVSFESASACRGGELIIETTLNDGRGPNYKDEEGFLATEGGVAVGGKAAILGCTICEGFDGRIFLSGNPRLPGTVFYSEPDAGSRRQPLYFRSTDFFRDGIADNRISALLSTHGSLAVFKERDDGSGTVIYHSPKTDTKTGEVRYPVSYSHGSIPAYGGAVNFFDEALFLTERGVCALERTDDAFKEVKCRSELINPLLLKEDLRIATVTEWQGYLVLAIGKNIYLADSRDTFKKDGILQYEWYRLTDIGTYKNDRRVYRYSDERLDGYDNSDAVDEPVAGEVYSELYGDRTVFFLPVSDKKLLAYKTEEFSGGYLDPCHTVFADEKNLYFGTKGGDLCIFNTDKRGVPPREIVESGDFNAEEYVRTMGRRIHPCYYSFDRHAVKYGVSTAWDDCDVPYLTKSSVRGSLVVKFKELGKALVTAEVETDNGGRKELVLIPLCPLSFDALDFSCLGSTLSDYSAITLPENEKGWTEKRVFLRSENFCSPFGVYSISYRYTIKGKIK